MCKFFSLISDGNGKIYYFNWKQRTAILSRKDGEFNRVESADSHSSISDFYGFTKEKADLVNKFEFNPLTKQFTVDQLNTTDDSSIVKMECLKLDFTKIVKPLIIQDIVNPTLLPQHKVTKADIKLLKQWISIRDSLWGSVGDSVWDSVGDSVGNSVRDSVWDSVRDSVRASIRDSVWASVWDSVGDSVGDSVWDSVWASVLDSIRDSVWAYISSFFDIKYKHDFSSAIKLWKRGFVPSFDGTTWRLHSGKTMKIVYELK